MARANPTETPGETKKTTTNRRATGIRPLEYADKLDKVRRYVNAAERGFFRTTKELAELRKAGPQERIGYVSQIAETPAEPAEEHAPDPRYMTSPEPENILQALSGMSEKKALAFLEDLTARPADK